MIKYRPRKRNVIIDTLLRKETPYIDESCKLIILPKAYLDKGVLLVYLAPMILEEMVDKTIEIVKRVYKSNC